MHSGMKEQKEIILLAYNTILDSLRTALYPWMAKPKIVPLAFKIDFKREALTKPTVDFALGNGRLESKLESLHRNNLVVLHYGFTVLDQGQEIARGLVKVRVAK